MVTGSFFDIRDRWRVHSGQQVHGDAVSGTSAGVFICIEAAYPWIARRLANEGADTLINISNDGYLGPTAVMRQHLANAIFRTVETGHADVTRHEYRFVGGDRRRRQGDRFDEQFSARRPSLVCVALQHGRTFYTKYGDLFVQVCAAITVLVLLATLLSSPRRGAREAGRSI